MSTIDLDWREVREDEFPFLCICCGTEATGREYRVFKWLPWWKPVLAVFLGVLALPIGVIPVLGRTVYAHMLQLLTRPETMEVRVPLCTAHEGHWRERGWVKWGGFGALALVGIGVGVGIVNQVLPEWSWIAIAACGLVWIAAALLAHNTMVRVVRITGTTITLTSVGAVFAEALLARREANPKQPRPPKVKGAPRYRVIGKAARRPDVRGGELRGHGQGPRVRRLPARQRPVHAGRGAGLDSRIMSGDHAACRKAGFVVN
jgi:hypothetical protein